MKVEDAQLNYFNNVFYVGDCSNHSRRSYARLVALQKLLPNSNFVEVNWNSQNLILKFVFRLYLKFSLSFLAPWYLLANASMKKNTLIWVDNFPVFNKSSLKIFQYFSPSTKVIFVSEDNFLLEHNASKLHLPLLTHYDLVFTTKDFVLKKLKHMSNIFKFYDSFDDRFFEVQSNAISEIANNPTYQVSFIGTFEEERYNHLRYLAKNNITVDVFGADWPTKNHKNLRVHPPVFGNNFKSVIQNSIINLIFLRHSNHDTVTSRSYEIPFFDAFLLAENSSDHLLLYKDTEILFSSSEDLLQKINIWLNRPSDVLSQVSRKTAKRIIKLDRSIFSETRRILKKIKEL